MYAVNIYFLIGNVNLNSAFWILKGKASVIWKIRINTTRYSLTMVVFFMCGMFPKTKTLKGRETI